MTIHELETPALLIDLDIMERNLARIADYARQHGLNLRPHTKTHKTPALARKQMDLGAVGITVAKVGEAEVMARSEPEELLVAFPVIGASKLRRLMAVAKDTRVMVSLDSMEAARALSEAATAAGREVGVLAETDVGLGRVGVTPGKALTELAQGISRLPGLRFDGVGFYPGHIKAMDETAHAAIDGLNTLLQQITHDLERAGVPARIVSGGSTPTLMQSHRMTAVNEIRPGTYIFNDRNTIVSGACKLEDCAASVLVTVVSTAVAGQMIVDGGSKTFSSDGPSGGLKGFGYLPDAPEAVLMRMNEEHGFVTLNGSNGKFRVGDRLRVIPNHVCVAVNLHETMYGVRGEEVQQAWKVEARGKLQ